MSLVPVNVRVDIGEARAVLDRYIALTRSPGPLMELAGGILENSIRDRFQTSTGPGGARWVPSGRQRNAAAPGAKGGAAMGPNQGGRLLIDKGGLLSSITHVAGENRVEVGVIPKSPSAKFARVHQFGATIRPKKPGGRLVFRGPDGRLIFARSVTIPARPFIGVDEQDRADLLAAWKAHLEGIAP